ncbi:hypothetical protein FOM00_25805 [Pseudomonas sp. ST1]|nr:hypothetical protein FOM00_25805 [Pseudomonas sp. ST1]
MIFARIAAAKAKNYSLLLGFLRLKILGCCFRRRIAVIHHRSSRSAWECSSGRSASNPGMQGAAPLGDAERHEMHANAEHWHDSHAV